MTLASTLHPPQLGISVRRGISRGTNPPDDPCSVLVLTTPGRQCIDIRFALDALPLQRPFMAVIRVGDWVQGIRQRTKTYVDVVRCRLEADKWAGDSRSSSGSMCIPLRWALDDDDDRKVDDAIMHHARQWAIQEISSHPHYHALSTYHVLSTPVPEMSHGAFGGPPFNHISRTDATTSNLFFILFIFPDNANSKPLYHTQCDSHDRSPSPNPPVVECDLWTEGFGRISHLSFSGVTTYIAHLSHVSCLDDPSAPFDFALLGIPFDSVVSYRPGEYLMAVTPSVRC